VGGQVGKGAPGNSGAIALSGARHFIPNKLVEVLSLPGSWYPGVFIAPPSLCVL
jgi:hypothetical protein